MAALAGRGRSGSGAHHTTSWLASDAAHPKGWGSRIAYLHALGEDVSHGCVRHDNDDIIAIYNSLAKGDLVAIVGRVDDPRLAPPTKA